MDDILIFTGDAVKALGNGRVGGYLARFTKSGDYDLTGDRFDAATDFGDADKLPVLFNHGMDRTLGRKRIGKSELRRDDVGLWVEAQLQQRDEYERAIFISNAACVSHSNSSSDVSGNSVSHSTSVLPL